MVLNTSFNVKGQPIVNTPEEAIETFLGTGIEFLFLENFYVTRSSCLMESNAEVDHPRASTIAEQFAQQARRTPDAIAVDCRRPAAELIANWTSAPVGLPLILQSLGVKPDTLVGVAMGRSETARYQPVGHTESGRGICPIGPQLSQRSGLPGSFEDSKMPVLLTTSEARDRLPLDAQQYLRCSMLKILRSRKPLRQIAFSAAR